MDNLSIKDHMIYMAADGDGIGKLVGRAVIANDVDQLHKISARIDAAQDFILHWAKQNDGVKISGGGDEFTAAIPRDALHQVEGLRKDIEHAFGYTISIGIGKDLAEAGTALLVAKLRGKDRVVHFNKGLKEDIKKAKRRVRERRATPDEYKLSEAYLKKSEEKDQECEYCNQTDGVDPDHCKWCHDQPAEEGQEPCEFCQQNEEQVGSPDCPFCQENPDKAQECEFCKQNENAAAQCPYCKEQSSQDEQEDGHLAEQSPRMDSPSSSDEIASPGEQASKEQADADRMEMNPPAIGKPEIGDSSPAGMGQANPGDAGAPIAPESAEADEMQANDNIVPEEGAHSKDHLKTIAQIIEGQTAEGRPENVGQAKQIDDTEVVGSEMEGNVSRPEGFDSGTPGDMGIDAQHADANDEQNGDPDLSSVLREGLDSQAEDIKKEKVRNMVGQALAGFKASKEILERAKEQAPDFYNANIAMLAAMIHMAELLGLRAKDAAPIEEQIQEASQQEENEWHDPFPTHPDQGGEAKPGHAASGEGAAPPPQQ